MIAALLDHLWQSTLFALGAGLLALVLRRASARVRYGLWLCASVKFLIPFAPLAAAGRAAAEHLRLPMTAPPGLAVIGPVFAPMSATVGAAMVAPSATIAAHAAPFDPAPLLAAIWALGLIVVLSVWALRWSRVQDALRAASPLDWPFPGRVLSSPYLLEPGVAGFWRPVLLVPEGIGDHLSSAELDAIVAHELCHVRRRDNLTGALHMLVQALFWFHPLVWWLGDRLIAERERACDEAVVQAGHDRETYARGIIETCRRYVQSPQACMAGVSGSNLERRVEDIMTGSVSAPLSAKARGLLAATGALALISPLAAGVLAAPAPVWTTGQPQPLSRALSRAPAVAAPRAEAAAEPPSAGASQAVALAPTQPSDLAPAANPSGEEIARRLAEQQRPRTVAPFDSVRFDRYVGAYRLSGNGVFRITRAGDRFWSRLTGQGPVELFPESDAKFFATVVAAQISFTLDGQGRATGLVLHQNGQEWPAPRMDEARADAIEDALARRVASNVPSPGTADFLERYLDAQEAGAPDFGGMEPGLASVARAQQGRLSRDLRDWGAVRSIRFSGVTPQGLDRYIVTFAYALVPITVGPLDADGKASGMLLAAPLIRSPRPASTGPDPGR
ncbi:MAG TPA: M56 family metallopeptidase [Caulobacteraceae bacterium]|jgi:beta-lactamase regulating signal transducer with metallopeptidase domain